MESTLVINFRNKFVEAFGLKENPELRNVLMNIFINFRKFSPGDASRVLFNLLYEERENIREETLNTLGLTADEFEATAKYHYITQTQISSIAHELRYQYAESNPKFLKIEDDPTCQAELDSLKRSMNNHPVLLYKAVEMCKNTCYSKDIVDNCANLLMSDQHADQMDGLKKMGHSYQYRTLLIPYSNQIGQLLQAMHDAYIMHQRVIAAQEELNRFPSPFANLPEMLEQKRKESQNAVSPAQHSATHPADESTAEEQSSVNQLDEEMPVASDTIQKYSLSDELSTFIKNKEELVKNLPRSDEFWACLKRLRKLGINLNSLLDYEEYLWAIWGAHDNLNDAITDLYDTKQAYEVAQKNFVMGDFETLRALFNAGKAHEDAIVVYNTAFDSFIAYCEAYEKVANS